MNSPSQVVFPELDDLEPLFSDQEEIQPPTFIESLIPSPSGTSAPLLSNPSLTDTLSNFPLFIPQTRDPNQSAPSAPTADPQEHNVDLDNQIAVNLLVAKTSYPHLQAEPLRPLEDQPRDLKEAQELDFPLGPRPEYMTEP